MDLLHLGATVVDLPCVWADRRMCLRVGLGSFQFTFHPIKGGTSVPAATRKKNLLCVPRGMIAPCVFNENEVPKLVIGDREERERLLSAFDRRRLRAALRYAGDVESATLVAKLGREVGRALDSGQGEEVELQRIGQWINEVQPFSYCLGGERVVSRLDGRVHAGPFNPKLTRNSCLV